MRIIQLLLLYNLDGTEALAVTEKDQEKREKRLAKMKIYTTKPSAKNLNSTIQKDDAQKDKKPASKSDDTDATISDTK